jgi:putative Mg2+ transporter-C (MgtC) family protein
MGLGQKLLSEIQFDYIFFISDILIPCFLALFFGGLIGFQREKAERPAGLRTHALVCLGSTVFTIVSYLGFSSLTGVDPSRVAAGIVAGIGFIGAGVIFRQGTLIKGVTTAASIWIVASIGISLGTKLYYLAVLATLGGFVTLSILKHIEDKVIRIPNYVVRVTVTENFKDINEILKIFKRKSVCIKSRKYEFIEVNDTKIYTFNLLSKYSELPSHIIKELGKFKGVRKITVD